MPANKTASQPSKSRSARTKAPSSYTYTGCWTCRQRHIKCDEAKPACKRCINAKVECQGYDFRFGSDASRSFRRPLAPGSKARQVAQFSNKQVSAILDELDTANDSLQKGPFSVLAFGPEPPENHSASHSPASIRPEPSFSPRNDSHEGSPSTPSSVDANLLALSRVPSPSPSMVREPPVLTIPGRQSELFEHWSSYLSHNLCPLTSDVNPFRYTYPSLALEGLAVSPNAATARLAVFHGICGTAAWSLSRLKQDESYHALSVYHDQMALKCIQDTIETPGGLLDPAIPAAIMTCLTGDTVSGRLSSWGKHLRGGYRCLLDLLSNQRTPDRTTSVVCQQYLLGAALGNFGTRAEVQKLWDGVLDEPLYIDECHCFTRPMLESVLAINLLAASSKRTSRVEIEKVRLKLRQSLPKYVEPVKHHLSMAYYLAIMIHFSTSLAQPANTQLLAAKAVAHLEAATATAQGNCGQILMWLLFKIGHECTTLELRSRLLFWCNSHLRRSVGNLGVFIGHLQSTWAISETTLPERSVFQREDIKVEDGIT